MHGLSAAVVLTMTAVAVAAGPRAPHGAYVAAYERALRHYSNPDKVRVDGGSLRSSRDPSWSLVNGSYGRGLWAAWVRRTGPGRYRVAVFRTQNLDPGPAVPCDIRPARAEPAC